MKKRIKPESEISTYDDADELLKQIGICEIKLERVETEQKSEILKIKEKAGSIAKPIQKEQKELEQQLANFLRSKEQDFQKEREKKRLWGKYGFRRSPGKLVTILENTWDKVLELVLKKATEEEKAFCVKTKIDLDKSTILQKNRNGEIENKRLEKFGMAVVTPDEPFWEPDRQALQPLLD